MRYLLILCMITLSGCELQSPDYYQIMVKCSERRGYYFTVTVPSWLGPRLAAGCAEDFSQLKASAFNTINSK